LHRIGILPFPADSIPSCNRFCSIQHRHVDIVVERDELRIWFNPQRGSLDQGDGLNSASDYDLHAINHDLFGCRRNTHKSRRTLTIDCHAGNGDRQTGAQRRCATNGVLDSLRHRAPQNAILHFRRVYSRPLHCCPKRM
jgi:hypothetical protein